MEMPFYFKKEDFLNYYNLPSIDLSKKFDEDLTLECIAPLNHHIHIGNEIYRREGKLYTDGKFTEK